MAGIRRSPSEREKRRNLELHRGKYRVSVAVPKSLLGILDGKTRLKFPLGTDSLTDANKAKGPLVAKYRQALRDAAKTGTWRDPLAREARSPHDPLTTEALALADARRVADTDYERGLIDEQAEDRASKLLGAPVGVLNLADGSTSPVYDPAKRHAAETFYGLATGEAIPLTLHHAAYLKAQTLTPRTAADDVRAIKFLVEWCGRNGVQQTVQALTKRRAVLFIDSLPDLAGGITPVTAKKYHNRLSRYWDWMVEREYAPANTWRDIKIKEPPVMDHHRERAFTRDEMVALLSGPATPHMHDLVRIAALTGARLEAIADLKVGDCANGAFRFKPQKKETSYRSVPIHSALKAIVARRINGKPAASDLFPEWPAPKKEGSTRERSFKASNAFTAYRRSVGVDETVPNKRRALTNFHSFRRWFITEAERAGQPESIIASVVGHKRKGMTLGVYSAGPSGEQFKACVEAVKLPAVKEGH